MEIKISTEQILKLLYILSWIIFIGLCIEAGGFIFNTFFALYINPIAAHNYWEGADFSNLYDYDKGQFCVVTTFMTITAIMKAIIFYLIVKILHDKKLNLSQPFNKETGRFIFNVSYLTLGIGIFSYWGVNYAGWLSTQGVKMPDIQHLQLAGADVWLFMSVTLFIIAQIFKKGIELQSEHELTI
ncbi:DUF2975 domain-containing protein [Flavobacterium pedocola]